MVAVRYEILSTLPPGAGTRTLLAWQLGDAGFRRAVVLREVPHGVESGPVGPAQQGVLSLLDLARLDGKTWAVYEFIAGATFAEVSAAHFSVDRLPSLGLIGRVVVDAALAIHRLHSWVDPLGLIGPQKHGGLSDASVFIGFDGVSRVLDLNARRLGKFIAPELTRGDIFDARADVFSLGALLHHATTRFDKGYAVTIVRAPSQSEFPPPSTVHPEATVELDSVVMRALMPAPGSRFPSALELAEELRLVLGPALYTHEQVNAVLVPLFGGRMAALKDLVDPKIRPGASRPLGNALDAVAAFDVDLEASAMDLVEDNNATQAHIDFDPNATPGTGRSLFDLTTRLAPIDEAADPSQDAKMSTAEIEPGELGEGLQVLQGMLVDGPVSLGEGRDAPTLLKPQLRPGADAPEPDPRDYEDPRRRQETLEIDPADTIPPELPVRPSRAPLILIGLLLLIAICGVAVIALRPDLVEQLRSSGRPKVALKAVVAELSEDLAFLGDAGSEAVEPQGGAGEEEEEIAGLGEVDAGQVRDAGKRPPAQKKKKKRAR